jgi:hypothetical protein
MWETLAPGVSAEHLQAGIAFFPESAAASSWWCATYGACVAEPDVCSYAAVGRLLNLGQIGPNDVEPVNSQFDERIRPNTCCALASRTGEVTCVTFKLCMHV